MNGAELLVRTAAGQGAEVCFANPGTTEMHLLGAIDAVPGVRSVLGLFEGVCTGAADGYARMSDRPVLTLLHLGPGFANGIANLHNARRARSPIVNLVGDHPRAHLAHDAPLTSDIASLAGPVSKWLWHADSAAALGDDVARAIAAARERPRGVSTLIVPADCAWSEVAGSGTAARALAAAPLDVSAPVIDPGAIERAARVLLGDGRVALLLGREALSKGGLESARRIAEVTGATLFCDTFVARLERGVGLPAVERLPYFPEQIADRFREIDHLVIVGSREPVAFFGYRDAPGRPIPASCRCIELGALEHDAAAVLDELSAAVDAIAVGRHGTASSSGSPSGGPARLQLPLPTGRLDAAALGAAIAALQPEGAIVVDEAATSGFAYWSAAAQAPPHTYLALTGGAIGQGLPCATGAAIACRDRRVIALQADGSGLYTAQALWTQAREGLDVTTVICANHEYRILRVELARSGVLTPGPDAEGSISLRKPEIDWVSLSRGFGVPAARVTSADALVERLREALTQPGPQLIEAVLT